MTAIYIIGVVVHAHQRETAAQLYTMTASEGNSILGMINRNIKWKDKDFFKLYRTLVKRKLENYVQVWCQK